MPTLPVSVQKYSKLIVAVLGVLAMLLSQGLLAGSAAAVVSAILAVATALGVYQVPNVTPVAVAKPLSVATYATNSGATWTTAGTTTVDPLLGVVTPVVPEPFSAPTGSDAGPYPSTPSPVVVAPVEPAVAPVVVPEAELAVAPQPAPEAQPEVPIPTDHETPA